MLQKRLNLFTAWLLAVTSTALLSCTGSSVVELDGTGMNASKAQALMLEAADANQLRAAIHQANASPGDDEIKLTGSLYEITSCPATDDANNQVGDFDILDTTGKIKIYGTTVKEFKTPCPIRIFDVQPGARLELQNLKLTKSGGLIPGYSGGAIASGGRSLVLTNVTIENSSADIGGAITAWQGQTAYPASLVINGGAFKLNSSIQGGGAIFLRNTMSLQINGTLFSDNQTSSAGLVHTGGAVRGAQNVTVTINNAQFTNNRASSGGALDILKGSATITGTTFSGNRAFYRGGAVSMASGSLQISGGQFTDNRVSAGLEDLVAGGGLNVGQSYSEPMTTTLSNVSFQSNRAEGLEDTRGGAIYNQNSTLLISNSVFNENQSLSTDTTNSNAMVGGGGAIFSLGGLVDLSKTVFTQNHSNTQGGALYEARTLLHTSETSFSENTAQIGGGAVIGADGSAFLEKTSFHSNTATHSGGAMRLLYSQLQMYHGELKQNQSMSPLSFGGGAIDSQSSTYTLGGVKLLANTTSATGGALNNYSGTSATLIETLFEDNSAQLGGGAINSQTGILNIDRSTFAGNSTQKVGGAIKSTWVGTTIKNSTLGRNTAGDQGHLIHSYSGSLGLWKVTGADPAPGKQQLRIEGSSWLMQGSYFEHPTAGKICDLPVGYGTLLWATAANNYLTDSSCMQSPDFTDAFNVFNGALAGLGPLGMYGGPTPTFLLPANSPIVDGYSSGLCQGTWDQRLVTRAFGSGCDYGAVEYTSLKLSNSGSTFPTWPPSGPNDPTDEFSKKPNSNGTAFIKIEDAASVVRDWSEEDGESPGDTRL